MDKPIPPLQTFLSLADTLQTAEFKPVQIRPTLLFSRDDLPAIRRRAHARPAYIADTRARCEAILATAPERVDFENAHPPATDALTLAQGYVLGGPRDWADWSKARIFTLLEILCRDMINR